ncbi:MAG: NfeD family protein [Notoacmeibacter sp.]|nr:NfeD family protein [Notoacmeibacter sp.]
MILSILTELGPWNWIVLGFVLLAAEILAPGVFLIWIGLAALVVGIISLIIWGPGTALWTWQVQVLVFLAMSGLSVLIGKRLVGGKDGDTDLPLLNRRSEQLVGRTATLAEPIVNGYGRVRIGDTLWRVRGTDSEAGTQVRIVRVEDNELVVEAA